MKKMFGWLQAKHDKAIARWPNLGSRINGYEVLAILVISIVLVAIFTALEVLKALDLIFK